MDYKDIAVYGIYPTRVSVERGIQELKGAGFRNADISLLYPQTAGTGSVDVVVDGTTKSPEAAATGAGTGAVIGGVLGWLMGIGTFVIPGFGAFLVAGPLMGLLAGAGAGGIVGGVAGALVGLGIPEYEARRYESRIKGGGILLTVHAENGDWKNRAQEILMRTGAEDISARDESHAGINR